ncbi:ARM repeat superfamily protein [Abeliophyllum distichum]|uniref:ARM repeat superfamily protein n=1 Tax=Abeliophyllum distichum TaxID=126358 RepID=A0ABD1Q1E3_9LAMI
MAMAEQVVNRIGKQLAAYRTCPKKDTLVKLLEEATSAFPELEQSESLKSTIKPLSDSLVRHGLLLHKDKDIRLLVGICFCEIIRILAPNPDFSDATFREKVEETDADPLILEGTVSQPLLDVVLHNLIKERKGVSSASFQLAVSVIQNCGEKLEHYICNFLRSCILNRDAVGSALKECYHEIIHETFDVPLKCFFLLFLA